MTSYKRIDSAIHNFGDSFLSLMNYVDDGYVIDELNAIHRAERDIEIDWMSGSFEPRDMLSPRIARSIELYRSELIGRLEAEGVDPASIVSLRLVWPARRRRRMVAVDNRGVEHMMYVREHH